MPYWTKPCVGGFQHVHAAGCKYYDAPTQDGSVHKLSQDRDLMRYTTRIDPWPSWDLPVLQWGKSQGGVVGFPQSGWGWKLPGRQLPNPNIPPSDAARAAYDPIMEESLDDTAVAHKY